MIEHQADASSSSVRNSSKGSYSCPHTCAECPRLVYFGKIDAHSSSAKKHPKCSQSCPAWLMLSEANKKERMEKNMKECPHTCRPCNTLWKTDNYNTLRSHRREKRIHPHCTEICPGYPFVAQAQEVAAASAAAGWVPKRKEKAKMKAKMKEEPKTASASVSTSPLPPASAEIESEDDWHSVESEDNANPTVPQIKRKVSTPVSHTTNVNAPTASASTSPLPPPPTSLQPRYCMAHYDERNFRISDAQTVTRDIETASGIRSRITIAMLPESQTGVRSFETSALRYPQKSP